PASAEEAAEIAKAEEPLIEEMERRQTLAVPVRPCHVGKSPCAPKPTSSPLDTDEAATKSDPLGGVDFSSLELRYVSDSYHGTTGVEYAYRVDAAPGQTVSYGGADAARLSADSFFVWLALPPSSFTVNLNPEEPDRIIDAKLGTTDA